MQQTDHTALARQAAVGLDAGRMPISDDFVPGPQGPAEDLPQEGERDKTSDLGAGTDEEKQDGGPIAGYQNQYQYEDRPDDNIQEGVREAEALTLTWTKKWLIAAYVLMFLVYLVNGFQSSATQNLGPFVVSKFEAHSLIPLIGVVSSVMSAATYLTVAKLINIWGRPNGFVAMVAIATLGLILSAVCQNVATYAAAQVFYSVGFVGMIFCIDVITADTSSLKDRGLAYAYTSSPYIIVAFAGPKAAEGFHDTNWRWAYGGFSIILPIVAAPLVFVLYYNKLQAKRKGLLPPRAKSGRTLAQSVWFYFIEFDIPGVFLIAGGLVLFLTPFNIVDWFGGNWGSAEFICMVVFGFLMLVGFGVYERFVAPVPFIPWRLLTSRTVLGAVFCDFVYQIAYYCWASYFTSYLMVVYDVSVSNAGYIQNTFDVVNGVWLIGVGFLIRRTGYFKWLMWTAVPLYMLGSGLMIYFRTPSKPVGYQVMCQIFLAFAGGALIICQQVAVLACANHNDAAAMLALLGLFGYVGGAVGGSISGAIWSNSVPQALLERLTAIGEEAVENFDLIYGDLDTQLAYPIGDPVRTALIESYAIGQRRMLIAGTSIMALSFICVAVIKNIQVSEIKQVKGLLF